MDQLDGDDNQQRTSKIENRKKQKEKRKQGTPPGAPTFGIDRALSARYGQTQLPVVFYQ
jgi:hypothetical protein